MEVHKIVHCKVRKGLGPEWIDKTIEVFLDDIEPSTRQSEIDDMVRRDVMGELSRRGYTENTARIVEIEGN